MNAHDINVAVHVSTGCGALLFGLVPLVSRKGGTIHRKAGRGFVLLASINLGTAIVGDVLYDPPVPLIAATLSAGYLFGSGIRALAIKAVGPNLQDIGLAIAGLIVAAGLLRFLGAGSASWTPAIGYSVIGSTIFAALFDLSRHFWRERWRRHAWALDHGLKMTAAFFAMLSASTGNIFRGLQPFSQIAPSLLGILVMGAFLARNLKVKAYCSAPQDK